MTVSIIASLGVGYLVGMLIAKWLHRRRRRPTPLSREDLSEIVAAIDALTTEVSFVRSSLSDVLIERPYSHDPSGTTAEFVSAPGSDCEDEFFTTR